MSKNNESLINVAVTFRHTEPTPALKTYAIEKVTHCLSKYVQYPTEAHVTLGIEKKSHSAEISVHTKNYDVRSEAVTEDLYSAIDKMIDSLVAQLRKQKERTLSKSHQSADPGVA